MAFTIRIMNEYDNDSKKIEKVISGKQSEEDFEKEEIREAYHQLFSLKIKKMNIALLKKVNAFELERETYIRTLGVNQKS